MGKALFIAEKPSVAQEFAKALKVSGRKGDGYIESDQAIVTWCVGHLVQFSEAAASLLSFPLYQTVIPIRHRNRYKKRRGSFFAPLLLCDAFLFSPCQFFLILSIHPGYKNIRCVVTFHG